MRALRARELRICFGVKNAAHAIAAVPDATQVTIHDELVHHPRVFRQLIAAGFRHAPSTMVVPRLARHSS